MNMHPKKILASDYDGTLRREGLVDSKDLEAIRAFRAQGNWFGIVTGRAYDMIVNELKHFGIQYDFLICNNGSVAFDHQGKCLYQINIDFDLALALIQWLEKEPDVLFGACDGRHYFSQTNGEEQKFLVNNLIDVTMSTKAEIIQVKTITAFFIYKFTAELTKDIAKRIDHQFNHRLGKHTNGDTIDIGPLGVSKSSALKRLQEQMPEASITTIGDHLNDMDMVRDFNGFAMNNGHEALKKVATQTVHTIFEAIQLLNQR